MVPVAIVSLQVAERVETSISMRFCLVATVSKDELTCLHADGEPTAFAYAALYRESLDILKVPPHVAATVEPLLGHIKHGTRLD